MLVLRGDAGMGKSVLLGYLSDRLDGWRVVSAVGVAGKIESSYVQRLRSSAVL